MLVKEKTTKEKIVNWLKQYMYVLIVSAVMLVLAIVLSVVVATSGTTPNVVETGTAAQSFYNPVLNFTVGKDYCADALMYNATLNQWEAHKSVDLQVAEGSSVYACLAGTVSAVSENYLYGTTIEITHDNGLITKYSSLSADAKVGVGDTVTSGQLIGTATASAGESELGSHLRLEVFRNGVAVDPNQYLDLGSK